MMPSIQVLLPAGALALYLFDSAMLLYGDEVVATRGGRDWSVSGGWDFLVLKRRPYLPNPLAPHRVVIRQRWTAADPESVGEVVDTLPAREALLRPVKVIVLALLTLLIGVLPVVSVLYGAGAVLLAVFASAYVLVVAGLVLIHRRRERAGAIPEAVPVAGGGCARVPAVCGEHGAKNLGRLDAAGRAVRLWSSALRAGGATADRGHRGAADCREAES